MSNDSSPLKIVKESANGDSSQTNQTGGTATGKRPSMSYLLHALLKYGASDLHIKAGRPPLFRINGRLIAAKMPDLTSDDTRHIIHSVLNQKQIQDLEQCLQLDMGFKLDAAGRFRMSAFHQKGAIAGVIRMIPLAIPRLDSLGSPAVLRELALKKRGLVLVTGATGSGKSTTLAAMVNHINENCHHHVITIEDPIEFVYKDIKSSISQREIGVDTQNIAQALMGALRQDPDVILIGEMRHRETIETALMAAETGHLVLATLHTNDAQSTIDRIIDVFPADAQNQIRVSLASSLLAVVSQRLIPKADGTGRVAACEIMIKSPTIEDHILNNHIDKIEETMATSTDFYKMQTFNQHLEQLVNEGVIKPEDAMANSNKPDELKMRLSGLRKEEGY